MIGRSPGTGMELDVIVPAVMGGASLTQDRGTALNTIIGVLVLGTGDGTIRPEPFD
jgi:ribose/xylose/arabinose/galactoside ABC-type transport system permease subunit